MPSPLLSYFVCSRLGHCEMNYWLICLFVLCRSGSSSGLSVSSRGSHAKRHRAKEKQIQELLYQRDGVCVITGHSTGLVASHIVPRNRQDLLSHDDWYSTSNCMLLRRDLATAFEEGHFILDEPHGTVTLMYANSPIKSVLEPFLGTNICIASQAHMKQNNGEKSPVVVIVPINPDHLRLKALLVKERMKDRCPHCWISYGAQNLANHIREPRRQSCRINELKVKQKFERIRAELKI